MNTDLAVIPGGMTGQLQPLDVCVNKLFKDRLRGLHTDGLSEEDHQLTPTTPTGRIKRASVGRLGGSSVGQHPRNFDRALY